MADFQKRSNGKYRVRYKDFTGKRSSKTFQDAASAKRFKTEADIDRLPMIWTVMDLALPRVGNSF